MARQREAGELKRFGPPSAMVRESWSYITMRDGYQSRCKVFQPAPASANGDAQQGRPLVVLFHGGGFSVGSPDQFTGLGRAIVEITGAVCVAPSYRLVPEHAFPTGALDAWDAIEYLAANAKSSYGADPARGFVVGGSSSGANLAAVVAQLAKDRGLSPPLTGQCLSAPVLMWDELVPDKYRGVYCSLEQNVDAPILPTAAMQAIFDRYAPDVRSPYFSPLNSESTSKSGAGASQAGLPPTYIMAYGLDCVRDDALIYKAILDEQGVHTRLDLHAGLPHNAWGFIPTLKSSLKGVSALLGGIAWLLVTPIDEQVALNYFRGVYGPSIAK